MSKELKLITLLLPIVFLLLASPSKASEGQVDLYNQENTDAECKAFSVLMPSLEYSILMTCRQITYPGDTNQFNYVAWAESPDGSDTERLGTIGVGKVEFETSQAFNRLFITRESSNRPRTPSTNVVMSGTINSFDFKEMRQPQPALNETPNPSPIATPTPTQNRSLISRLFTVQNVVAVLGVVLLLVLVFILTRR